MSIHHASLLRRLTWIFGGAITLSFLLLSTGLRPTAVDARGEDGLFEGSNAHAAADDVRFRARSDRFTLRLGQGFRFKDGVVVPDEMEQPDLIFKFLPPVVGGMATRYNPMTQQIETGFEP